VGLGRRLPCLLCEGKQIFERHG